MLNVVNCFTVFSFSTHCIFSLHLIYWEIGIASDMLWAGWPGLNSWKRKEILFRSIVSPLTHGITKPPIQWVGGCMGGCMGGGFTPG
jgi:hypothetical protein